MRPRLGRLLLPLLLACKADRVRSDRPVASASASASVSVSASPSAAASAGASAPAIAASDDAGALEDRWVSCDLDQSSDDEWGKAPHRVSGRVVKPWIELPARAPDGTAPSADVALADFPNVEFRVRDLPAISADGTRIAYVFSRLACCRLGRPSWHLYVIDAHTGRQLRKLPISTVDDEPQIPQRGQTQAAYENIPPGVRPAPTREAMQVNDARFLKILATREQAANAALAGEWRSLGTLEEKPKYHFAGEGVAFHFPLTAKAFDIRRDDGRKKHVETGGWTIPLPGCPKGPYALGPVKAYVLRGELVLLEVSEDDGPDGCETSSMRLLRID